MKLLFENFGYETAELTKAFGKTLEQLNRCFRDLPHDFGENKCSFEFVGYYYCSEIGDSVYVMPKVFINRGRAFCHTTREDGFDPNNLINITFGEEENGDGNKASLDDNERRLIFNVSLWLYQSIKRFCEQIGEGNILNGDIQRVVTAKGKASETMLDSVISLNNFYRSHRSLFTFISINKSANNARINWRKTIATRTPLIQDGVPIYMSTISKAKSINYDDDVIVLFLSVMNYLSDKYYFGRIVHEGYNILPPHKVEVLLEDGIGVRKMRQIRHKYFTDELVQLCDMLTVFFEQASEINSNRQTSEMTIVKMYDKVFEAMIDSLVGDKMPKGLNYLKHQEGGSRHIDHLCGYDSLIKPSQEQIYYIGDSKYYKETTALGDYSVEKQYSYAKNVIQYCIDIFEKKSDKKHMSAEEKNVADRFFYRDDITEGYNITPNFFVEGIIRKEEMLGENDVFADVFLKENPNRINSFKTEQHQFKNRLFDRDTLLLRAFDINFLFVLNSYVSRDDNYIARQRIKEAFKNSICKYIDEKYCIYKFSEIDTKEKVENFIDLHFRTVIGKVISYKTKSEDEAERSLFIALERKIVTDSVENALMEAPNITVNANGNLVEIDKEKYSGKKENYEYAVQRYYLSAESAAKAVELAKAKAAEHPEPIDEEQRPETDTTPEETTQSFVVEGKIKIEVDVNEESKYVEYLPLFSIKAACGKFKAGSKTGFIGWINAKGMVQLKDDMFVVQAFGDSMEPKISNGDYCVFRKFINEENGNRLERDEKIVLVEYNDEYDSHYVIKKYHPIRSIEYEGNESVELISLNKTFKTITLNDSSEDYRVKGVFEGIIKM